jgi:phage shock protein C
MEKIFRRDKRNKVLGGVCSGLGRWTDTDTVLWKLIFILGTVCTVFPFVLSYILMWIIVPEE